MGKKAVPKKHPKATKLKATNIIVILDRSGSMASVKSDTIGGFNTFLAEQKKAAGEARLTLVQFDNEYAVLHDARPVKEVPSLTDDTYQPRGSTALLDAVGKSIVTAKSSVKAGENVVVVVLTDGHENCSKEFTRAAVKSLVDEQAKVGWQFVYLGANQDAFAEAGAIGIAAANAANFVGQNVNRSFKATSKNIASYRASGQSAALCYSQKQRDELASK